MQHCMCLYVSELRNTVPNWDCKPAIVVPLLDKHVRGASKILAEAVASTSCRKNIVLTPQGARNHR